MKYEYPFTLKLVSKDGSWCSRCAWHRFCRGCPLPCDPRRMLSDETAGESGVCGSHLAIDWDQTALHLRYLSAQEKAFKEDASVGESQRAASEPITLKKCLEAFTREEELGEEEKYYCSNCKKHQEATKKLQIWRLPPILVSFWHLLMVFRLHCQFLLQIVHLKRFHFLNGRWIKSHKIVDFPSQDQLDPADYLAAIPAATLKRYRQIGGGGRGKKAAFKVRMAAGAASAAAGETIQEMSEPNSLEPTPAGDDETDNAIVDVSEIVLSEEEEDEEDDDVGQVRSPSNRPRFSKRPHRMRQVSTSLMATPVMDDNLEDFHEHRLEAEAKPLDVKYNL